MKKLTFILSISLTLSAFGQVPNYVPTDGLVGWWPFNGNANDESGNGNNGIVNGAALTADRYGVVNSAYDFNGNNNFINVPHSSVLVPENALTIACWFQATSINTGLTQTLISKGVQSSFWNYGISITDVGIVCYNTSNYGVGTMNNLNSNSWYHIVFTIDQNLNTMFEYVDGEIQNSLVNVNTNEILNDFTDVINACCSADMNFGKNSGGQAFFGGSLDDIGIWNRALTPQEVAALYNGCQQTIAIQPQSQTVNFSANVQFSASSSDATAAYQWQTNVGAGFQNLSDAGQYSGTLSSTLIVSNVGAQNVNQQFRCVIQSGACSDTTEVALLQVCGSIQSQPSNQNTLLSNSAQFSLASSDPNATYQWQTNLGLGFQNLTDAGQYSGSATNTLSISNVTLSNNNQQFRCIVNSGSCSDTSSVAILTVVDNVGIEDQNQLQLLVYPNPASSTLTIENPQGLISNFVVIDASGREVLLGQLEGETNSISIAHLSIGKYIITFEQKAIKEIKFIKE
jgi:hypothetical protein